MECEICLKPYKDPTLLSCGDKFCLDCIKSLLKDTKIICPTCNKPQEIPDPNKLQQKHKLSISIEEINNEEYHEAKPMIADSSNPEKPKDQTLNTSDANQFLKNNRLEASEVYKIPDENSSPQVLPVKDLKGLVSTKKPSPKGPRPRLRCFITSFRVPDLKTSVFFFILYLLSEFPFV